MRWKMLTILLGFFLVAGISACEYQVKDQDGNVYDGTITPLPAKWDAATWDQSNYGE